MRALPPLRRRLLAPTSARGLRDRAEYWCLDTLRRARRWQRPTGLLVVLLGADGAGKSTVSEAVRQRLAPLFRQVVGGHFAPDLLGRAAARGASGSGSPHDQTARSRLGSVAKSLYWLFDFSVGYWARIRPALVRSTLVVYDRYLPDALVDPRRYRFRGPSWLLRAVCRLVPAPDLLVLLDASVATLRARKQEVAVGETQRQQGEYRALVAGWPNGRVVNADGPVDQVVATVDRVVLEHLAQRTAERLGI
jgi:thymidylate kinase